MPGLSDALHSSYSGSQIGRANLRDKVPVTVTPLDRVFDWTLRYRIDRAYLRSPNPWPWPSARRPERSRTRAIGSSIPIPSLAGRSTRTRRAVGGRGRARHRLRFDQCLDAGDLRLGGGCLVGLVERSRRVGTGGRRLLRLQCGEAPFIAKAAGPMVGMWLSPAVVAPRIEPRETGYLPGEISFTKKTRHLPKDKTLIVCTKLARRTPRGAFADGERRSQSYYAGSRRPGCLFVRVIPGNEVYINNLQNALARKGCEIVTRKDAFVHVSGHPARDELTTMYRYIRPQIAVPVHGEHRHLTAHAELAGECGVNRAFVLKTPCVETGAGRPGVVDVARGSTRPGRQSSGSTS